MKVAFIRLNRCVVSPCKRQCVTFRRRISCGPLRVIDGVTCRQRKSGSCPDLYLLDPVGPDDHPGYEFPLGIGSRKADLVSPPSDDALQCHCLYRYCSQDRSTVGSGQPARSRGCKLQASPNQKSPFLFSIPMRGNNQPPCLLGILSHEQRTQHPETIRDSLSDFMRLKSLCALCNTPPDQARNARCGSPGIL